MSIGQLLKQTVAIENPGATVGKHGDGGFGSSVNSPARFQKTTKTIIMPNGERQPIDGIVFVGPDVAVAIGSRATYSGSAYRVMAVEDVIGRGGVIHHKELKVQLWSFGS